MAAQPYLGDIAAYAFNFAPVGWKICDGSLLSIAENDALFSLIGVTYGGDGVTTFALPDLRGRNPIGASSNGIRLGESGGTETASLQVTNLPAHTHTIAISQGVGTSSTPSSSLYAVTPGDSSTAALLYGDPGGTPVISAQNTLQITGQGAPFEIREPYLAINWCIAMEGIYPSRP